MNILNKIFGMLGGKKFVVTLIGLIALYVTRKTGVEVRVEDIKAATDHMYAIAGIVGSYVVAQGIADAGSKGATSSVAALAEAEKK